MNAQFERIWKETVMGNSRYYPGIFPEGMRKTTNDFSHDNWCPRRDSIRALDLGLSVGRILYCRPTLL
jgi:hypothetical protein